jgi:hypothetical protein
MQRKLPIEESAGMIQSVLPYEPPNEAENSSSPFLDENLSFAMYRSVETELWNVTTPQEVYFMTCFNERLDP